MLLKSIIKRHLLKLKKNIIIDRQSEINFNVRNNSINPKYPCRIIQSICNLEIVNEGCIISEARCYGDIILGRYVSIAGPGTVIKALKEKIYIGSFSSIGQNVCIIDFNHNFNRLTSSFINYLVFINSYTKDIITKGPVIIEEDVFVGSNSIILPGVTIGRGSIIGGGCVVTSDIPRYSMAYGNPAKCIKLRFKNEVIELLEGLGWWDWETKRILRNQELFNANLNELSILEIQSLIRQ